MSIKASRAVGFDPDFDDTAWTEAWLRLPVARVPETVHPGGYRVERRLLEQAEVFGRPYRLSPPFDCRVLYDPEGRLWMSNTPQEHIMMYNNAARSWGHVLVGGLGLGIYPQYAVAGAAGQATGFTILERSDVVKAIAGPVVAAAVDAPVEVRLADVAEYLAGPVRVRYDTIFLDIWHTLDAALLPGINRLRDLALRHLGPDGRLMIWGYRWLVRLFEDACRQLLAVAPVERSRWLAGWLGQTRAASLLVPVAARFAGQPVVDIDDALAWCRRYIVTRTE